MPLLTEADTCRKYVLPKLYASGWSDDHINEQRTFTDGRIVVAGNRTIRRKQKRADYLLRYRHPVGMSMTREGLPVGHLFENFLARPLSSRIQESFRQVFSLVALSQPILTRSRRGWPGFEKRKMVDIGITGHFAGAKWEEKTGMFRRGRVVLTTCPDAEKV